MRVHQKNLSPLRTRDSLQSPKDPEAFTLILEIEHQNSHKTQPPHVLSVGKVLEFYIITIIHPK